MLDTGRLRMSLMTYERNLILLRDEMPAFEFPLIYCMVVTCQFSTLHN